MLCTLCFPVGGRSQASGPDVEGKQAALCSLHRRPEGLSCSPEVPPVPPSSLIVLLPGTVGTSVAPVPMLKLEPSSPAGSPHPCPSSPLCTWGQVTSCLESRPGPGPQDLFFVLQPPPLPPPFTVPVPQAPCCLLCHAPSHRPLLPLSPLSAPPCSSDLLIPHYCRAVWPPLRPRPPSLLLLLSSLRRAESVLSTVVS